MMWLTAFQPKAFQEDAFQIEEFVPGFPVDPERFAYTIPEYRFVSVPFQPIHESDGGLGRTVSVSIEIRVAIVSAQVDYVDAPGNGDRSVTVSIENREATVEPFEPATTPERSVSVSYENRIVFSAGE